MELFWKIRLVFGYKFMVKEIKARTSYSTVDHLVTFRTISLEFHNTKINLFLCFVDIRKYFDTVPRKNI
jgi:hypothetical protein